MCNQKFFWGLIIFDWQIFTVKSEGDIISWIYLYDKYNLYNISSLLRWWIHRWGGRGYKTHKNSAARYSSDTIDFIQSLISPDNICHQSYGPGENTSHNPLPGNEGGQDVFICQPVNVFYRVENLVGYISH